jgi:hypothetical protein
MSGEYCSQPIKKCVPENATMPLGMCSFLEPTTGIEPVNLFLTKEVLYLLSYVG